MPKTKPKITIEPVEQPVSTLEADIIFAGTPEVSAEEKKRALAALRRAKEFVFSPEQVAELAKEGITPEDVVEMMLKGDFSELRRMPD